MKIRGTGMALVAVMAVAALATGVAHAEGSHWRVGGGELSGSASIGAENSGPPTAFELDSPELGVKLTATGVECAECTIENVEGVARTAGRLRFTGVAFAEPEACKVASTLETVALSGEVVTYEGAVYRKTAPAEGETFITIKISECALAGKYKVTGTVAGRSPNLAGEELVDQALVFNGTNTAGAGLKLGGKGAVLMGEAATHLTGAGEGEAFGPGGTGPLHWNVEGSELSGSASIATEKVGVTRLELDSPELGVKLTATGVECVECTIETSAGTARTAGKLRFTGVTIEEPSNCTVSSTLETKQLAGEALMYEGVVYGKTAPAEGETFITIKISECAIAAKYNVTGTVAGRSPNATGEELVDQALVFNGTNTAGTGLKLGGKGAVLTGEVATHLTGAREGQAFGPADTVPPPPEEGHWNVEGSELSGSASIVAEKVSSTALELAVPGLGIDFTATGIECVECTIENSGTAHSAGKLRFTGVAMGGAEGCVVASSLETKAITGEVVMYEGGSYERFFPEEGETFITIKISECALAGKYNLRGTFAGRFANETGVESVNQALTFNGSSTAGTELNFGQPATLMGEVSTHLTGAHEGEAFGATS